MKNKQTRRKYIYILIFQTPVQFPAYRSTSQELQWSAIPCKKYSPSVPHSAKAATQLLHYLKGISQGPNFASYSLSYLENRL